MQATGRYARIAAAHSSERLFYADMRHKIPYITAFVTYIAAVLVLCLMKTDGIQTPDTYIFGLALDKVAHMIMFMPFPVLGFLVFHERNHRRSQDFVILTMLAVMGTGLAFATEYLQSMTEYRSSDIYDSVADMAGLAVGCISVLIYIIFRKQD